MPDLPRVPVARCRRWPLKADLTWTRMNKVDRMFAVVHALEVGEPLVARLCAAGMAAKRRGPLLGDGEGC